MKTKLVRLEIQVLVFLFSALLSYDLIADERSEYVFVDNFIDLYRLEIRGNNPLAEEYWLQTATTIAGEGLKHNNYYFHFVTEFPEGEELFLHVGERIFLKEIAKVNKVGAHCTSTTVIDTEEILKGGDDKTHIEGICGQIATIHSLVKLKKWQEKDIKKEKAIKSDTIKKISKHKKKFKSGMTLGEIIKAHNVYGANECRGMTKEINVVKKPNTFKRANQALARFLKEKPVWDCVLSLSAYNKDRKLVFSHVEHIIEIEEYDKESGGLNLKTINGLKQGKIVKGKRSDVPLQPGSNTWSMAPGTPFPITMSDSEDDRVYKKFSNFIATQMQFVCCRQKP